MAYELVYTSAPEGLQKGSSGFCVVACTKGLGPRLIAALEGLSAYKPLYPHYAPNAWNNPVSHSHYLCQANGERQHVLSRICFNGVDHTRRSNKLASHLVLWEKEAELAKGGPSSLLLLDELFKDATWQIKAEYYLKQREIPATAGRIGKCTRWEAVTGDAGWAGYLAQTYLDSPRRNVYIAYDPEQNREILTLFHEALNLLPEELRWQLTFSTYFVNLPVGMSCTWRGCPADSEAIRAARRSPANLIIDITKPCALEAEGELIELARSGIVRKPTENVVETESHIDTPPDSPPQPPAPPVSDRQPVADRQGPTTFWQPPRVPTGGGRRPEHAVPPYGRKNRLPLIAVLIALLLLLAGGGGYWGFVMIDRRAFAEKKGEYLKLAEAFAGVEQRRDDLRRKRASIRSEKAAAILLEEVKELGAVLESIKANAEKLRDFQRHFERENRKNATGKEAAADETPDGLIASCALMQKDLKNDSAFLMKRIGEIRKKRQMLRAEATGNVKPPLPPPPIPALPTGQAKTAETAAPAPPVPPSPKKNEPQQLDAPRYLWRHSDEFHKPNGKLEIRVGRTPREKILFRWLPEKKFLSLGKSTERIDANDRTVTLNSEYSDGVAVFTLRGTPQNDEELLLKLGDDSYMPLYFRLDVSRLKPTAGAKAKDNLTIRFAEKISIRINASAFAVPEKYYDEEDVPCASLPVLMLKLGTGEKVKLAKNGEAYVAEWEVGKLRDLFALRQALDALEEKIRRNPEKYLDSAPDDKKGKILLRNYRDLYEKVEKQKPAIAAYLKLPSDSPEAASASALYELLRKEDKKELPKKTADWMKHYRAMLECAPKVASYLIERSPLKKLDSRYTPSHSLAEEARKRKLEWEDETEKIRKNIESSTMMLFFNDRGYEQFAIAEIVTL